MKNNRKLNRRDFLLQVGMGSASAMALLAMGPLKGFAANKEISDIKQAAVGMTYRINKSTKDKVSLLGYGMMRLPTKNGKIDQEMVNREVDYAIEHGVNYFDTAPIYHGGQSEYAMGIALKRHPRNSYFVATKMSNMTPQTHPLEESIKMYRHSMEALQVDYIDYYLLHGVGQNGMDDVKQRFFDNKLIDFLLEERKAGHIRNLGFSYHGDVHVFDWLLDQQDKYHWDFCQIEVNYVDWRHASSHKEGWKQESDADAEYLYNKCEKLGIQNVIMEPLLGGRLANLPEEFSNQLKALRPNDSIASWGFRWVASLPNVLTTLSGMTYMEHVEDNVKTFSPLQVCTDDERALMLSIADGMNGYPTIPCTKCSYCMPCPYGVDIPGNFAVYNEAVNKKQLPLPDKSDASYSEKSKLFIDNYKKSLSPDKWADQCADCEECLPKCPQKIRIPNQMARLVDLIEA